MEYQKKQKLLKSNKSGETRHALFVLKKIRMSRMKILLVFLLSTGVLFAQEQKPAFWKDIQSFKKKDSVSFPPPNAILFVGSSSFTMWKGVQKDFPSYTIINRGFGGSSLPDIIRYAGDIIFPYQPKQIVIYCGDNDLAAADSVSAQMVFKRFQNLFRLIRMNLPETDILYVAIKPSPSRWHLKNKMVEANELIRKFLKRKKQAKFVNVWKAMLGPDGKPMSTLFLEDKLHMNASGYAIWQKLIEPHLLN